MFDVIVETSKTAEKAGCGRAYLARLAAGPRGSIDRTFAPKVPGLNGNRRAFKTTASAGDVFEARRWWWNAAGERYDGGNAWFGVMSDGSLLPLTRDEAIASVHAPRIESGIVDATGLSGVRPARMDLPQIAIRPSATIAREGPA